VRDVALRNNTATAYSSGGSAVAVTGAGAYVENSGGGVSVIRVLALGNVGRLSGSVTAQSNNDGGGLYVKSSVGASVANCTLVQNRLENTVSATSSITVTSSGAGIYINGPGSCNYTRMTGNSISLSGVVGTSSAVSVGICNHVVKGVESITVSSFPTCSAMQYLCAMW
jgi:hypothetical protein